MPTRLLDAPENLDLSVLEYTTKDLGAYLPANRLEGFENKENYVQITGTKNMKENFERTIQN